MIFKVFCCAAARSGNKNAGPRPAATVPTPANLIKSLRDTPEPFFLSFINPPQFLRQHVQRFALPRQNLSPNRIALRKSTLLAKALYILRHIFGDHRTVALHHDSD